MPTDTLTSQEPRRHFDIELQDGSLFAAVEGADETDAIAWLGAQLGQDIAHLVHDWFPTDPAEAVGA